MSNSVFPNDDDAMHVFTLHDKEHNIGLDKEWVWIGFFEMKKSNFKNDNQRHWREFLLTGTAPDGSPEYIQKAQSIVDDVNLNEEERSMVTAVQRAEDRYYSVIDTAYEDGNKQGFERGIEQGLEQGLEQGAKQKAEEIAKKLKKVGTMTNEEIAKTTGLSASEVEKL